MPFTHSNQMAGLTFGEPQSGNQIKMPASVGAYSSMLYDCLHRLDGMGVKTIYVQWPPEGLEWEAVRDRLQKASE